MLIQTFFLLQGLMFSVNPFSILSVRHTYACTDRKNDIFGCVCVCLVGGAGLRDLNILNTLHSITEIQSEL